MMTEPPYTGTVACADFLATQIMKHLTMPMPLFFLLLATGRLQSNGIEH